MAADTSDDSKDIFTQKYSGKQIFIIVSIVIVMLLLDTSVIRLSDLTLKSTSIWTFALFAFISAISLVGQNLVLRFIKHNIEEGQRAQKNLRLNSIYKVAIMVHYVLAAILVFVILEMLITSRYDVISLTTAITISYIFSIVMMGILSHRFFTWFRLNRSYVIFLYGLSSGTLLVNAFITLLLANSILLARPPEVMPHAIMQVVKINDYPALNYAYTITTIISFIITWFATMGLLRNYTEKMRRFTYQIILILPLAYFVSQFLVFSLGLLGPTLISNPIFYGILFTIIFTLSKPIGGIIFGIGFWMIARNIHKDNVVRSYLIISGYGFLLFFTSTQAILLTFTYYPPFGLVTISFVGLSSYLVLAGIYSSALAISQDANLRRQIRLLAIRESKLLDSIGSAQMEMEITKRVLHIVRKNKTDMLESGIPSALDEENMHSYLNDVLEEIKTSKKEGSFKNEPIK
jgi:hypothetical protein